MVKTLSKHGNSWALVIEKPVLDLLEIDENTPLVIRTNGRGFYVEPQADACRGEMFQQALDQTNQKYGDVLRRLAE